MDSLYRDRFDVFIGIDAKVNPRDGGGHRTCEIRHGSLQLLARQMSCARLFLFFFLELLESKKKKKSISKACGKIDPKNFFLLCATAFSPFRDSAP